ncbi:MAG: hypothetical protein V4671_26860 [Armatimonadota bacterium]
MHLSRGDKIGCGFLSVLVGGPVILIAGAIFLDKVLPSNVRRALPTSATDIHEYDDTNYFLGEMSQCLKAKMPESEMPGFAARMGLTARYSTTTYGKLRFHWHGAEGASWWDPPDTLDGGYLTYKGTSNYSIAKYENGYVYFTATDW